MVFVYILKSLNRNYTYVGQTDHVIRRFHEHNNGQEKNTRAYAPFMLVLTIECIDRTEARKWEKFYKAGEGRARLKQMFLNNL